MDDLPSQSKLGGAMKKAINDMFQHTHTFASFFKTKFF